MNPSRVWLEQGDAARAIEDEFGTDRALAYLIGEKFINFLSAAETDEGFRAEIPAFVAEIRTIFERWQLAAYLDTARQTERFDPSDYDDHEEAEIARRLELHESANDLLLVERARQWLVED